MLQRGFDILGVIFLLLLFFVPMLIIVLYIFLFDQGKIFFVQERVGRKGKVFKMLKFRTMNENMNSSGEFLPDSERITKFGNFLRSTSLDELPEIWNVLKGEMSLVGPRPLLVEYLPLYNAEQARRHEVRPGITGWAQVNGRNAISWEEKFKLDVWYIDNRNLWLDIKILWLTAKKVLVREGISASGEATMSKFQGSSTDKDN